MAKLKVFRTPIGFHDAYVAAPSQKAALAAWGSDADLFARGVAELVTDDALTAEPLAHPGEVIRRLRGTAAEQLAAAPPREKRPAPKAAAQARPAPRPDRKDLDAAEAAVAQAEQRHRVTEEQLAAEERALAERRRTLRADWAAARDRLEAERDAAAARYADAVAAWRAG